jgi:hypothetical protein
MHLFCCCFHLLIPADKHATPLLLLLKPNQQAARPEGGSLRPYRQAPVQLLLTLLIVSQAAFNTASAGIWVHACHPPHSPWPCSTAAVFAVVVLLQHAHVKVVVVVMVMVSGV